MKCAACGYSDQMETPPELRYHPGKPFNEIKFMESRVKMIPSDPRVPYPSVTLYACPNCGTVKMEVK